MNVLAHPSARKGLLRIDGGIYPEEKALAIKAALEDLPGVYETAIRRDAVELFFEPNLASEQQFYEAVKVAGFQARNFDVLGKN
jgi:hypothetical protein